MIRQISSYEFWNNGDEKNFGKAIYHYFPDKEVLVDDYTGDVQDDILDNLVWVSNNVNRLFREFLKSESHKSYIRGDEYMDIICGEDYVLYFGVDDVYNEYHWECKYMVIIKSSVKFDQFMTKFD